MPPAVYKLMRSELQSKLKQHFEHVETPIEGPAKVDYGDVDVLVAGVLGASPSSKDGMSLSGDADAGAEREKNWQSSGCLFDSVGEERLEKIYDLLGVVEWTRHGGKGKSASLSFCVPWPTNDSLKQSWELNEDDSHESGICDGNEGLEQYFQASKIESGREEAMESSDAEEAKFIQVDVTILRAVTDFRWQLFHHAHGDLWNILGSMIRPFGLTVNESGLNLRIPGLEKVDRKKSMVNLSADSDRILSFLGLRIDEWNSPFKSEWDLYNYAAECNLFCVSSDEDDSRLTAPPNLTVKPECDVYDLQNADLESLEKIKAKLKHNDRRRLKQRPLFQKWLMEFLPFARRQECYQRSPPTREHVRDEAFEQFGDRVRDEYNTKLETFELGVHRDLVYEKHVKGNVPDTITDQAWKSHLIKALKRCIMDGEFIAGVEERNLRDERGFYDIEAVGCFVKENWQLVGDLAWEKAKEKMHQGMARKVKNKLEKSMEEV